MICLFPTAASTFEGLTGILEGVAVLVLMVGLLLYADRRRTRRDAGQRSTDKSSEPD